MGDTVEKERARRIANDRNALEVEAMEADKPAVLARSWKNDHYSWWTVHQDDIQMGMHLVHKAENLRKKLENNGPDVREVATIIRDETLKMVLAMIVRTKNFTVDEMDRPIEEGLARALFGEEEEVKEDEKTAEQS